MRVPGMRPRAKEYTLEVIWGMKYVMYRRFMVWRDVARYDEGTGNATKGKRRDGHPAHHKHTCKGCIALMSLLSHVRTSHVTPTNESQKTRWARCAPPSHTSTRPVTHLNASCHIYVWVMSHVRMRHVALMTESHWHTNESCHTRERVVSHARMSRVTRTNESCHTHEWVVSHVRMSHVTHTNESCHTYEWVM